MKMKLAIVTAFVLITCSMSAQTVTTWVLAANATTNLTLLLPANQVMEVLSLSMDDTTSIDVTVGDQTITFGEDGNELIPQPLVIAGPANVVLRRSTTGDDGSMMTFRVVQIERPQPAGPQASAR